VRVLAYPQIALCRSLHLLDARQVTETDGEAMHPR
jgi:hypothetical protein